jgi:hypothetical protein
VGSGTRPLQTSLKKTITWLYVGKLNRQYYRLHLEAVHSINENCDRLLSWTLSQQNLEDAGGGPAATISSVANIMKMKGITIERSKASRESACVKQNLEKLHVVDPDQHHCPDPDRDRHPGHADPDPADADRYQFQAYVFFTFSRKSRYAVENTLNHVILPLALSERKTLSIGVSAMEKVFPIFQQM